MDIRPLTEVKRRSVADVVGALRADGTGASKEAGVNLIREASSFGLDVKDYLTLAIDTRANEKDAARFSGLTGFEAAICELNLPFRNDFDNGVVLQAATDTFERFPGTRALFPEVIDTMLRWQNRQNQIETVAPLVSNSRTINGTVKIATVVNDDSAARGTFPIAELGRIPVRTIRTSQTTVSIYKHGSGYETSYEFTRRATIDMLTPFANRVVRELELSKVSAAVNILVNGDGVNSAASVVNQSTFFGYDSPTGAVLQYKPLIAWLTSRAKAGTPVDTVVGDYNAYIQWIFMFAPVNVVNSVAAVMQAGGKVPTLGTPVEIGKGVVNFAVATAAPANKLVGFTKGETLEELVEAGSQIAEADRAVQNQSVTYVKTENTGYNLVFGDTRSIYNFAA